MRLGRCSALNLSLILYNMICKKQMKSQECQLRNLNTEEPFLFFFFKCEIWLLMLTLLYMAFHLQLTLF